MPENAVFRSKPHLKLSLFFQDNDLECVFFLSKKRLVNSPWKSEKKQDNDPRGQSEYFMEPTITWNGGMYWIHDSGYLFFRASRDAMWCPQTLYLLVYKPHECYSYLHTINHSYWSYVHQLNYLGGTTLWDSWFFPWACSIKVLHRFNAELEKNTYIQLVAPSLGTSCSSELGTATRAHRRFYHCCELLTSSTMTHDAAQGPCPSVEADGQLWIINHYDESLLILIDTSFYVVK